MLKGFGFWLFLAALPALAALGHDGWLFYQANMERDFMFSDIGFLWTTYHAQSFKMLAVEIDPEYWRLIVKYIMTQKAFFVGSGFFLIVLSIFSVIGFMRLQAEQGFNAAHMIRRKSQRFKYKRR